MDLHSSLSGIDSIDLFKRLSETPYTQTRTQIHEASRFSRFSKAASVV
jgi:hypothetical protein